MREIVNVNLIRVFEGRRHERLRFLWDTIAEYASTKARIHWFANTTGMSHASCLAKMWEAELKRPERYALITEHDFLPDLRSWLPIGMLSADRPVLVARYVTRNPDTRKLRGHSVPGAWYILVDKQYVRKLHLEAWGECNDPANGLEHFLPEDHPGRGVRYLDYQDGLPDHYGVHMTVGDHLFWSRHLHDHENTRIAGVCMGDMQRKHDSFIMTWVRLSPERFRDILRRRLESYHAVVGSVDDPSREGPLHPADLPPAQGTSDPGPLAAVPEQTEQRRPR